MAATRKRIERTLLRPPRTGLAVSLAAVIGDRGKACEFGDGLVGVGADLGQIGHQPGDGAAGDALHRAPCLCELRPQGIVVDHRGDLTFERAGLAPEQGDDLVDAGQNLGIAGQAGAALFLDGEIVGDLPEPCHQGFKALLTGSGQRRRPQILGFREAGDDAGIEPVGLLQHSHRLGIMAYAARIGHGAGHARFPQQQKRSAFVTAARLHRHQAGLVLAAERRQFSDPVGIVVETREDGPGLDAGIETGLRNIHSTNKLHHGNLPCSCDCDPATVRSYVTTAKIPGSPTVVAGGVSGDIAHFVRYADTRGCFNRRTR